MLLALVVRVALVLSTPHFTPQTDAADYDRIAVSLAQHNQFPSSELAPAGGPTAFRGPLFPMAVAAVYKLVGVGSQTARWEAARLFEALLGAISVALIGLIAARLWDRRVGLLAAGIAALYPPLVLIGSSVMTESLFIPLVLAAVLSALIQRDSARRRRWSVLTGVLVALAALSRSNGILLLLPICLLVWSERPRLSWRSFRSPLVVLAVAIVTLVPWTIRNAHAFHTFVPITTESGYAVAGTYNTYAEHRTDYPALWLPPVVEVQQLLAHHPSLDEAQISSRLNRTAIDYVDAHPAYVPKALYWNTLRLLDLTGTGVERWAARYEAYPAWLASLSVYTFWAVGLLALGGAIRGARRVPLAFWLCPVVLLIPSALFLGSTRYRSPADPFVVMLAAVALLAGWRKRRGRLPVACPVG